MTSDSRGIVSVYLSLWNFIKGSSIEINVNYLLAEGLTFR